MTRPSVWKLLCDRSTFDTFKSNLIYMALNSLNYISIKHIYFFICWFVCLVIYLNKKDNTGISITL